MVFAADYPFLDVLWTMLVFFAWVIWFWLLITVFGDLFRRHDISGWAKAGWIVFVLVLPLVGTLTYLITQGRSAAERDAAQAELLRQQADDHIRSVAAAEYRGVDEIARAKQLLDNGAISRD